MKIGRLELLQKLLGVVSIPKAVYHGYKKVGFIL